MDAKTAKNEEPSPQKLTAGNEDEEPPKDQEKEMRRMRMRRQATMDEEEHDGAETDGSKTIFEEDQQAAEALTKRAAATMTRLRRGR